MFVHCVQFRSARLSTRTLCCESLRCVFALFINSTMRGVAGPQVAMAVAGLLALFVLRELYLVRSILTDIEATLAATRGQLPTRVQQFSEQGSRQQTDVLDSVANEQGQQQLKNKAEDVRRDQGQKVEKVDQPPAKSQFQQPLPEWNLLPDSEVPVVQKLQGEGIVSATIRAVERSGRGVLFNAVHRDPSAQKASKQIVEAARAAKRMHQAFVEEGKENTLGYIIFTEREPWEFLNDPVKCRSLWPECEEWGELKQYFTHVQFYDDLHMQRVIERRERFQTWPELWLKRIYATLHSPFEETLVVDSDVYACESFEALFDVYLSEGHVAITKAPAPFGCSRNYKGAFRSGMPDRYQEFTERNLGLQVLKTGDPKVIELVSLFKDVYLRQVNDTEHVSIGNDQSAFREALFTMYPDLVESIIPPNIGCRHDAGCADGCLVVHRHQRPELSGAEYDKWKKEQNKILQEKKRAQEEAKLQEQAKAKEADAQNAGDDDDGTNGDDGE
eukprot:m.34851 g.34851  ORF g.34851 m.34851 type:complete len:502 (+) comp9820_c0_seq1:96-1601(+)